MINTDKQLLNKRNKMRGGRERTAFQYKNKKFQQAFMQELSMKNSNNTSMHNGAGSPHAMSGSHQQVTLSYCNINNLPASRDQIDIPDYNALIELQNQLKREHMKLEEKLMRREGGADGAKPSSQKNGECSNVIIIKESVSGASASTQGPLASSIASGCSSSVLQNGYGPVESKSLTSTLSLNGKLMPLVTSEYTKKKNLLLQNFPTRVSTPSKMSLQLLDANSSNYRESFTDFSFQVRSNLMSRQHARTDMKDSGMLNINATQVVTIFPKGVTATTTTTTGQKEDQQTKQGQDGHQIVLCKREGGGIQLALQKPHSQIIQPPMRGSLSQNIIIGTKLNPVHSNGVSLTSANNQSLEHHSLDQGASSPGVRPFEDQNTTTPLKKMSVRPTAILTPSSITQQHQPAMAHVKLGSAPQGQNSGGGAGQTNLLPPLKKQQLNIQLNATSIALQSPQAAHQNASKQYQQQQVSRNTVNVGNCPETLNQKSLRKQDVQQQVQQQHGGDIQRIGGGGFVTTHSLPTTQPHQLQTMTTSRLSLNRTPGPPTPVPIINSRNPAGPANKPLDTMTLDAAIGKPPPSPTKGSANNNNNQNRQQFTSSTDVSKVGGGGGNIQSPDVKNATSPKQSDNKQHSILRRMITENMQLNKAPNVRNNQSPFTAIKKEQLLNSNIVRAQYTFVKRSGLGASPALPPPQKLTQESFRPRSKQGSVAPPGLPNQLSTQLTMGASPSKKSIFQTNSKFSSRRRLSGLNVIDNSQKTPQEETHVPDLSKSSQIAPPQYFNRFVTLDDQDGISSEESSISDDPEEFSERLKYLVRNDEAVEFSQYCVQWLQRKREKIIKNSFAANINMKRIGPNNITQYDHIGYCPDKSEPKWKKEVSFGQGPTIQPPSMLQRDNQQPRSQDSTRASSAPTSDMSRDLSSIYRIIVKDELKLFDESDVDQIVEQAQLKVYPNIQAKQWGIAEPRKGTIMYGKDINVPNEIASQTKIMTAYVVMKMIEELDIEEPKNFYIRVTKKAEKVKGTKAGLIRGQLISIYDCLHALMLPSGNDAALTLATAFGKYLHFSTLTEKRKNVPRDADDEVKKTLIKHLSLPLKRYHEAANKLDNKMYIQSFVAEMNKHAKFLKIEETTQFTNPHGLSDKNNHSTPADICRIATNAMRNEIFKEIVCRKFYECTVISREHNVCLLQWFNSNKLLNDFFLGIKTGTTPSAGPCLCGYFQYGDFCAIACVMNTKTTESRFKDMAILFLWALDKFICGLTCSEPGNNSSNVLIPNWSQPNSAIAMKRRLKWTNFSTTAGVSLNTGNVQISGQIQDQLIQEEDHSLSSCIEDGDQLYQQQSPEKQEDEMNEEGAGETSDRGQEV